MVPVCLLRCISVATTGGRRISRASSSTAAAQHGSRLRQRGVALAPRAVAADPHPSSAHQQAGGAMEAGQSCQTSPVDAIEFLMLISNLKVAAT